MKEFKVKLFADTIGETEKNIVKLVNVMSKHGVPADLKGGMNHYTVDASSFLGVFSICSAPDLTLQLNTDDDVVAEEIASEISEFVVA